MFRHTTLLAAATALLPMAGAQAQIAEGASYWRGPATEVIAKRRLSLADKTSISSFLLFSDFSEVDGAAMLLRTAEKIGYTATTRELEPGHAYTNWFVAFNEPQNCAVPCECGIPDLFTPAVNTGIFYGTGAVADAFGQATFTSEVDYGEIPGGFDQAPAPFAAEADAEIHVVVRTHGMASADPATRDVQLTQFDGGCPPGGCVDVQVSVHRSPFCKAPRGR